MTTRRSKAYHVCICGMMIALAMIFSYLEALIPVSPGIPGVKLGLANVVTMVALYQLSFREAALIGVIRVILSSILFSNLMVMLYSLAGTILSLIVMLILKRCNVFGITGVSVGGGVAHNMGQLIVAFIILENQTVMYYAPALILFGTAAGVVIGIFAGVITRRQFT